MPLLVTIVRWLMIIAGVGIVIFGVVVCIASRQSNKKFPVGGLLLILWGLVQIAYIIARMIANSYNW